MMHVSKIDEYKSKINHNVWEEIISVTPCIDICIVGDDDRCVTCGRTALEMALVSDAEKL